YHTLLKKKSIRRNKNLENLLRTRPVRSLSGIVNVSVLTKPYSCPGKCIFCPTEKGIPKSYVSGEPAVERAKRLKYDPYNQVAKRIEVLEMAGHPVEKIELRVIGGTWSFYDKKYKTWFVKTCFDACNNSKSRTLEQAQKKNEKARHRIIGLSFETRPDFINKKEIKEIKELGATKIELGVQTIYDDVLKLNKRGHGIKETIEATKMLKDAGFKVAYQMMLNLPGSSPNKDVKMFKELFHNENFQPDSLKIYPCALVKETPLYKLYLKKKYKPYSKKTLMETIVKIKKHVPEYVRIERIIRDIPATSIVEGGAKISNLRQMIDWETKKQCRCIRCREIKNLKKEKRLFLFRKDYKASQGKEIFLSFEDEKRKNLYSLLRLRIPSSTIAKSSAIVRELHTYGQAVDVSKKDSSVQHKGLGKKLLKEAERISKKEFKKLAVISGVGVRDYYRKLGYRLEQGYMTKKL
ncbi:MAG: tRNA uridine(34) 5-carboxymethylaminomethyl modification radical SAM/GNAT enzyme Elp3, partial [Candidatus Pacebacteria bacterium]|nr:tRNA uridine(34) 5-carboxymethylaminomethyl modification radical SAM/GNAT enzyme Elp3 [Candidatus Paceibacterota bacterium]